MTEYESDDVKATDRSGQSPECTEEYEVRIGLVDESEKIGETPHGTTFSLEQVVGQLKLRAAKKERVQQLKSGELDREDLDAVPFYKPSDWGSYEQYEEIVGGVSSTEESGGD